MDKPECGTDYLGNLYLGLIMNIASLFFVIQACGTLAAALSATNSRGLVVGHTPQTIGGNRYSQISHLVNIDHVCS